MEDQLDFRNWEETKEKLQEQYPQLTREDLEYEIGKEAELLLRIQKRLGKTKEQIRNWLSILG